MMLLAPSAFKLLGWRKTAKATPNFLLFAGAPFFLACTTFQAMSHYQIATSLAKPLLLALAVRPMPACCFAPCCMAICKHKLHGNF